MNDTRTPAMFWNCVGSVICGNCTATVGTGENGTAAVCKLEGSRLKRMRMDVFLAAATEKTELFTESSPTAVAIRYLPQPHRPTTATSP